MDLDFLRTREAVLANGDCVSLASAVVHQARLRAQLASEEGEWDVVYHLREVCLGRPIDPEPERHLAREGWLDREGRVDPTLRSVVLSAVRGEGRELHLDSPFTDKVDRALAEFFVAREQLLAFLDPADRGLVFEKPEHQRAFDTLSTPPPPPADAPPLTDDQVKSFVDRVNERLDRPPPPGPPHK